MAADIDGTGSPLLLIHGFPHNRSLWMQQIHALRGSARCIAPDLRGFGESDAVGPYSIDQYADDMAELLDAMDTPSATVMGLSMGGYAALAMWRRHRGRIGALVLADTRAGADTAEGRSKRDEAATLAREHGIPALADAQISGMLGKTTRSGSPEIVSRVRTMLSTAPLDGTIGALRAMRDRSDSTELLATVTVPTLIVVGDEDVLTPPREARTLHESIPGSSLEVIVGAGHLSNLERPREFNAAVLGFLSSLSPG
jgi:pimeloyl-ACP methyl ester carboxylesterase